MVMTVADCMAACLHGCTRRHACTAAQGAPLGQADAYVGGRSGGDSADAAVPDTMRRRRRLLRYCHRLHPVGIPSDQHTGIGPGMACQLRELLSLAFPTRVPTHFTCYHAAATTWRGRKQVWQGRTVPG